ncbi:hypothetical protein ASG82_15080 [Mycobacterium sp. Soil538]|nr:hypothetical protein ASG82_15080 [Mycobacterium sp. Soil538]
MSVLDLRTAAVIPAPASTLGERLTWVSHHPFRLRMAAAVALTAAGWAPLYAGVVDAASQGSRSAYLLVVPVLLVMIAAAHRTPPRGVGDAESDWIVVALVGAGGFTAIHLLADRLPTLAGLWRLPLLSTVVWFACVLTVLFGVRHVVRMWAMWLFALCITTPLPVLLATAALGGSGRAVTAVAAAIGALAVALSTRAAPPRVRLAATVGSLAIGLLLAWAWTGTWPTVFVAGVLPVLVTVTVVLVQKGTVAEEFPLPARSPLSAAVLVAVAATLLLTASPPAGRIAGDAGGGVEGNWTQRTAWGAPTTYGFITRYLGPGSRWDRFSVPPVDGLPAAAVDVVSTDNAGALRDVADAVWYPAARPLTYRNADPSSSLPTGARTIHSNADAATTGTDGQWYAVTWTWHTPTLHQQVTVIVSQALTGVTPPPPPAPLSVSAVSVRPALWLARQQPEDSGQVDDLVRARASDLVETVTAVARHRTDGPAGA